MTQHCEWNNTTLRQQSVFENSPTSRRPVPPTNRTRSRSTNQRGRASQASRPDRVTILPQRIEATSVMAVSRCGWATNDPLYIAYHDREWQWRLATTPAEFRRDIESSRPPGWFHEGESVLDLYCTTLAELPQLW